MNLIPVLYEDEEIFIINKPAGLAVQGGQGITHSVDVDFAQQTGNKVYLVHRLDKDTAGLMIVAKSSASAGKWTKLIGSKAARKEYIAICSGVMERKNGCIEEIVVQHGENKKAVTYYNVEKEWNVDVVGVEEGQKISIPMCQIRLKLETGRMHQIRIHLAKNECPIAGDDQHGNFKINKLLKKQLKIKKLLLASVKLTIPLKNETKVFEIELPDYMKFRF